MDERVRKHLLWIVPVSVVVVFGAVALVQGLVVQQIGIGTASVKFGERHADQDHEPNGREAATPSPSAVAGDPGGSAPGPTTADLGAAQAEPVVGSWSATRGDVVIEVTRVENQGGHLRVDATVTNGTGDSLSVPLFGTVTAVDETGRGYEADPANSDWVTTIGTGQSVAGTIEFGGLYAPGPGTLDISFAELFGFDAPTGGIVVTGVPRP